jgi:Icc-related predicted phosphoesterase
MSASRSAAAVTLSVARIESKSGTRSSLPVGCRNESVGKGSRVAQEIVRVAAAGDIHAGDGDEERIAAAFATLPGDVDLVLLAGDLTTHGEPEQAAIVADVCRGIVRPVLAVLGNHDWHANRCDEVVAELEAGGIVVLNRASTVLDVRGVSVGVVGAKGFVGGFPDSHLPDFGEPSLRRVYAETTAEVEGIAEGLRAVEGCAVRIVLLHYAPTTTTLEGEPRTIWAFLGTDRLAPPLAEHEPDQVLHGHGHRGRFDGFVAEVPVYNVAVQVTGRDFTVFELDGGPPRPRDGRAPQRGQTL